MMVDLVSTKCDDIKMAAFTDDFSAAGKLKSFLQWWITLLELGPKFGYLPEPAKSWFITKPEKHPIGKELFKDNKFRQKVPRVSNR